MKKNGTFEALKEEAKRTKKKLLIYNVNNIKVPYVETVLGEERKYTTKEKLR